MQFKRGLGCLLLLLHVQLESDSSMSVHWLHVAHLCWGSLRAHCPKTKVRTGPLQLQFWSVVECWYLLLSEWMGLLFPVGGGQLLVVSEHSVAYSSYYFLYIWKNEQHLKMFVVSKFATAHIDHLQSSLRTSFWCCCRESFLEFQVFWDSFWCIVGQCRSSGQ